MRSSSDRMCVRAHPIQMHYRKLCRFRLVVARQPFVEVRHSPCLDRPAANTTVTTPVAITTIVKIRLLSMPRRKKEAAGLGEASGRYGTMRPGVPRRPGPHWVICVAGATPVLFSSVRQSDL
jgi:hypothetical protein